MPLVEAHIERLTFKGMSHPALTGVDLAIDEGEILVVSGPVAAGKSALCHCLTGAASGFYQAHLSGRVQIGGLDPAAAPLASLAGLVGYLTQEPQSQLVGMTVAEDVALGPCHLGLPRDEIRRRVAQALGRTGLVGFEGRAPDTLSGGEAQRAALAAVLALKPRFLVLDQPAAELDPPGRDELLSHLAALAREGLAILLVHERPEEVRGHRVRHLRLEGGRMSGHAYPAGNRATDGPTAGVERATPTAATRNPHQPPAILSPAAVFEAVTHVYPGGSAGCQDVQLHLTPAEILTLAGPNGSGKTTVAKHVNGLLRPTRGRVAVLGREWRRRELPALRRRVSFSFQNPDRQLFASTVAGEVAFGPRQNGLGAKEIAGRTSQALEAVGLSGWAEQHPHRLSRGQRRLLALATVLAAGPEILVADEPTGGLDAETAARVRCLLRTMAIGGVAVLGVTHDEELIGLSDRTIYMDGGRVVGAELSH